MVLGFMNAHGQEPDKVGQMLDVVGKFGDTELLAGLSDATGIQWEAGTANRLFNVKQDPADVPELNLGKYANHPDIVEVSTAKNEDGGFKYILDIKSKRYLQQGANLINNIFNYNKDAKNIEIEFTINGELLPNKSIKL